MARKQEHNSTYYVRNGFHPIGVAGSTVYRLWHVGKLAAPTIFSSISPGPGLREVLNLTSRWASLDSDVYPGAGPGTLTPDGRLDPLLAFTYDAVITLAGAIESIHTSANKWGSSLSGFVAERCVRLRGEVWGELCQL